MSEILYTIDDVWPGRLSVVPRPRGGDWLEDEAQSWKLEGIDTLVSLLTPTEFREFDLTNEGDACKSVGIEFMHFPIDDMSIPSDFDAAVSFLHALELKLNRGSSLGIHCRQSIGRSGLIAASLMIARGIPVARAVADLTAKRGRPVPESDEQMSWLNALASRVPKPVAEQS